MRKCVSRQTKTGGNVPALGALKSRERSYVVPSVGEFLIKQVNYLRAGGGGSRITPIFEKAVPEFVPTTYTVEHMSVERIFNQRDEPSSENSTSNPSEFAGEAGGGRG